MLCYIIRICKYMLSMCYLRMLDSNNFHIYMGCHMGCYMGCHTGYFKILKGQSVLSAVRDFYHPRKSKHVRYLRLLKGL